MDGAAGLVASTVGTSVAVRVGSSVAVIASSAEVTVRVAASSVVVPAAEVGQALVELAPVPASDQEVLALAADQALAAADK